MNITGMLQKANITADTAYKKFTHLQSPAVSHT